MSESSKVFDWNRPTAAYADFPSGMGSVSIITCAICGAAIAMRAGDEVSLHEKFHDELREVFEKTARAIEEAQGGD